MRPWLVRGFERFVFARRYHERAAAHRREHPNAWEALARALTGLDTPWRVASFLEASLGETTPYRLFDVPRPPAQSFSEGVGNDADYAALALIAFATNGREAYWVSAYGSFEAAPASFCAMKEEDGGWHQISSAGLFGGYARLEEIVDDVVDRRALLVVRDAQMNPTDAWRDSH